MNSEFILGSLETMKIMNRKHVDARLEGLSEEFITDWNLISDENRLIDTDLHWTNQFLEEKFSKNKTIGGSKESFFANLIYLFNIDKQATLNLIKKESSRWHVDDLASCVLNFVQEDIINKDFFQKNDLTVFKFHEMFPYFKACVKIKDMESLKKFNDLLISYYPNTSIYHCQTAYYHIYCNIQKDKPRAYRDLTDMHPLFTNQNILTLFMPQELAEVKDKFYKIVKNTWKNIQINEDHIDSFFKSFLVLIKIDAILSFEDIRKYGLTAQLGKVWIFADEYAEYVFSIIKAKYNINTEINVKPNLSSMNNDQPLLFEKTKYKTQTKESIELIRFDI